MYTIAQLDTRTAIVACYHPRVSGKTKKAMASISGVILPRLEHPSNQWHGDDCLSSIVYGNIQSSSCGHVYDASVDDARNVAEAGTGSVSSTSEEATKEDPSVLLRIFSNAECAQWASSNDNRRPA